jgi:hypothetical protein
VRGRTGGRAEWYLRWAGICGGVWRGHMVTELIKIVLPDEVIFQLGCLHFIEVIIGSNVARSRHAYATASFTFMATCSQGWELPTSYIDAFPKRLGNLDHTCIAHLICRRTDPSLQTSSMLHSLYFDRRLFVRVPADKTVRSICTLSSNTCVGS